MSYDRMFAGVSGRRALAAGRHDDAIGAGAGRSTAADAAPYCRVDDGRRTRFRSHRQSLEESVLRECSGKGTKKVDRTDSTGGTRSIPDANRVSQADRGDAARRPGSVAFLHVDVRVEPTAGQQSD